MLDEMVIRRVELAEAEELSRMICENGLFTLGPYYSVAQMEVFQRLYSPDAVAALCQNALLLCGDYRGELTGSIALEEDWIVGFYTAKNYLGQGVGTALIEHVEAFAKGRKILALQLESSPAGLGFYLKHGWTRGAAVKVVHHGVIFHETHMTKVLG